nr:unnamed protein product [Callosobruchus analis]
MLPSASVGNSQKVQTLKGQHSVILMETQGVESFENYTRRPFSQEFYIEILSTSIGRRIWVKASGMQDDMFLYTLGESSDSIITQHLKARRRIDSSVEIEDRRGESARMYAQMKENVTDNVIENHINSFHPYVSHYKLDRALLRRYLSPEINISPMWKDFCMSKQKISYEKYRLVVEKLNIGFGCLRSLFHNKETDANLNHNSVICETCIRYHALKAQYTSARYAYEEDKGRKWPGEVEIYTVNPQKVLLLPNMTIKDSCFISILVTFNETSAPLY